MDMYVIAFESTHYAILIEKKLKSMFKVEMIPTPRCITTSCGLSLKLPDDKIEDIKNNIKLLEPDYNMVHLYKIIGSDGKFEIKEIDWSV